MTIVCPNCNFEEPTGAIFCSECGTKLIATDGLATASIRATESKFAESGTEISPDAPTPVSEAQISLHIIRTGQILPLIGRTEYTLGRISKGQSILPDVDLSPYDAYSQGVSRLHSTIKVIDEKIYIEDLGSSNGTRINNQKILSHNDKQVQHGDVIALGRFKIQILIRQE